MLQKINNPLENCLLKLANDGKGEFEGYGSVWNSNDKIGDTVAKGAFVDAIMKGMPKMFINHQHMDIPVGDYKHAEEDDHGLKLYGVIDMNHRDGPSAYSAMLRKAMSGLSIGAWKKDIISETKSDGGRLLKKIGLKEVSIVTFPMEENAAIMSVKSEIETINSFRDAESFLRDSGVLSKSTATALVSRIKYLVRRDAGTESKNEITKLEAQLQTKNATKSLVEFIEKL